MRADIQQVNKPGDRLALAHRQYMPADPPKQPFGLAESLVQDPLDKVRPLLLMYLFSHQRRLSSIASC